MNLFQCVALNDVPLLEVFEALHLEHIKRRATPTQFARSILRVSAIRWELGVHRPV